MKTLLTIGGAAIILLIGGATLTNSLQEEGDVIARNGLHWHPKLEIYVKGEKVAIPQNIGIGAVHQPMHTHDDLPVIHLEFNGTVHASDLMLGQFFTNWGTDMHSFGQGPHMLVNGVENTEYERYILRDGDVIELHYD